MSNKSTIKAAIRGSIAHPEAAEKVIAAAYGETPLAEPAAAVANIAVPASATAADCANKINELLASLRAAGLLAS